MIPRHFEGNTLRVLPGFVPHGGTAGLTAWIGKERAHRPGPADSSVPGDVQQKMLVVKAKALLRRAGLSCFQGTRGGESGASRIGGWDGTKVMGPLGCARSVLRRVPAAARKPLRGVLCGTTKGRALIQGQQRHRCGESPLCDSNGKYGRQHTKNPKEPTYPARLLQ